MNITVQSTEGTLYTDRDIFSVSMIGANPVEALIALEEISGPSLTHGGGAPADEYLHYKSHEFDVGEDGFIDYSNMSMEVVQKTKGTSVFKILVKILTFAQLESFTADYAAFEAEVDNLKSASFSDEEVVQPKMPDNIFHTVFPSGEITINWEDAPVI